MKVRIGLLALLGVGVVVYAAFAATVVCPGGACGAAQGTTANPDTIIGTAGIDNVVPLAGNDIIYLRDGADTVLCAAAGNCDGNDFIDAGPGGDRIGDLAGANQVGNDIIFGRDGRDILDGGPGDDYIDGGADLDYLGGFGDNDVLLPGLGIDYICDAAVGAYAAGPCSAAGGNPFAALAVPGPGDDIIIIRAGDVPAGALSAPPAIGTAEYIGCGTGNDTIIFLGFPNLGVTTVAPETPPTVGDIDLTVIDPLTGGEYVIGNDGANACTIAS